jgi:hypothetical protein
MLNSVPVRESFSCLTSLVENLETKNDSEPIEVEIVDAAYQVIEKLNLLQTTMKNYNNSEKILTGSKLSDLYDITKSGGTSTLFDD